MGIFKEYLNSKGKVETGTVCISGDRTDPMTPPNKPPKGHSSQKAYSNGGKKSKKGSEKGFGDMGDQDTKYDPCCNDDKGKKPAKIPTAEQAFAELELVPLVTEAVAENPALLEKVVYDLKRTGQLGALVAEVLSHRETYKHMAEIMSNQTHGPSVCKNLSRAMATITEEVDAPFHKAAEFKDDEAADEVENDMENQDTQDEMGLDDEPADMGMDGGDDVGNVETEEGEFGPDGLTDPNAAMGNDMAGMEPPNPLMSMGNEMGGQMKPHMAAFQRAFQRSFQRNFQRKMMSDV